MSHLSHAQSCWFSDGKPGWEEGLYMEIIHACPAGHSPNLFTEKVDPMDPGRYPLPPKRDGICPSVGKYLTAGLLRALVVAELR